MVGRSSISQTCKGFAINVTIKNQGAKPIMVMVNESLLAIREEAERQAERRKNRQEIAKEVMLSMIPVCLEKEVELTVESIARSAVRMADALINELSK